MSRETKRSFTRIFIQSLLALLLFIPLTIRAANKTLVILPLTIYADKSKSYLSEGVKSILVSRLSGGDLHIISDEALEPLLSENEKAGITSKDRAGELARSLKADYALFGSITTIGGGYSLDLSLLELQESGSKHTSISEAVNEDQFIPRMADVAYRVKAIIEGKEMPAPKMEQQAPVSVEPQAPKGMFSKLAGEGEAPGVTEKGLFYKTPEAQGFEPTGRISVGMDVMSFDMGDVDGAGGTELVVLGREKLMLYQRQGASFVRKETLKAGLGDDFLKVSVGDADNDGRAEIYLVSSYGARARTTVYEWTGEFKKRDRMSGHLQVVKYAGESKPILLYQESKAGEFFSGKIYVMTPDKEGKFTQKEPLPAPKGVQFYTLARYDLNKDGAAEWFGLQKPGLREQAGLIVWDSGGNIVWSGNKKLGGTNNAIRTGERTGRGDPPPRVSFNSRLVVTDIDGDGRHEVLAAENISLIEQAHELRVYTKAKLTAFTIEGASLVPAWTTRELSYCITDIQAEGGTLFLAAHKGSVVKVLTKEYGYIMWFK
ncbi:MAG: VCBS repeat-containing protein [Pseudomonadota bacterium]